MRILYSLILFSCTLFAMEKNIESTLQNLGIKISRIDISPSELGPIRLHRTKDVLFYLANCSDGQIIATFCAKKDTISCRKRTYCHADGTDGVYQRYSERDIDVAHYHLLRILHENQERQESRNQ